MAPTTSTGPPFGESLADAECRDSGQQNNDQRMAETKPVAPNTNPDGSDNPEGRQKNRGVELTLTTR